jgi:hypothetical protein
VRGFVKLIITLELRRFPVVPKTDGCEEPDSLRVDARAVATISRWEDGKAE